MVFRALKDGGWDEACLHNLLECPCVQGQASLGAAESHEVLFSQVRKVQVRVLSASVVAHRFPL